MKEGVWGAGFGNFVVLEQVLWGVTPCLRNDLVFWVKLEVITCLLHHHVSSEVGTDHTTVT